VISQVEVFGRGINVQKPSWLTSLGFLF